MEGIREWGLQEVSLGASVRIHAVANLGVAMSKEVKDNASGTCGSVHFKPLENKRFLATAASMDFPWRQSSQAAPLCEESEEDVFGYGFSM